jgi:hypothetical protein
MAEARDKAAWNRTFAVVAQLYNTVRGEKSEAIDPMQFFPWERPEKVKALPPTPEQEAMLDKMFSPKPKG